MRILWTAALALTLAPRAAAQRDARPAHTAFAFGWSDVTGYGTAVALLHRLPHLPLGLGIAAGGGGLGAHVQVQLPYPFVPRREDHEPIAYLSGGMARLFGRDTAGVAAAEWAVVLGGEAWPDQRPGLFADWGFGVVGPIGGSTPGGHLGGVVFRFLVGWAF